ncbi:MAG: CPBP family intramembrane metalloprotease [Clostridia bacterium]|nr:CPBP family intramembrane metalloprotease [Clostridia bacterium]
MRRLYEKNELLFAILWIVIYVVSMSIADGLSQNVGIEKSITVVVSLILSSFLLVWIKKSGLSGKYGLVKGKFPPKTYLYFLPLVIIVSVNFWGGINVHLSLIESVFYVISMLCVGLLEEIIFRGFLFKYLCKDNLTVAIIVSSITFGIGHIVNLLSGADVLLTFLQIIYATCAGFLFTVIFYKSGSMLPCIITHSLINATSVIVFESNMTLSIITAVVLSVVSLVYALWIIKSDKKLLQK